MLAHIGNDTTAYQIIFLLHVLFAIVGFGATFALSVAGPMSARLQGLEALGISKVMQAVSNRVVFPFVFLTGFIGFGLVGMSADVTADERVFEFSQTWILLAIVLWLVGMGIGWFVLKPASAKMLALQEELAEGPPASSQGPPPQVAQLEALGKQVGAVSGVEHLIFAALLVLMVFKPGF